jgi:streptogramin lyase
MAQLTLWDLPLNPPNPYPFYLQYLTPEQNGKLYYTKYILNVIGELDVTTASRNVREWRIPPALLGAGYSGDPMGITYDSDGKVWFALQGSHRLVQFDPRANLFTSYGGSLPPIPYPSIQTLFPIAYPRHLMFDEAGGLWYTGTGTNGALIGRLDPSRRTAVYWDLPIDFLTPEGIWVEPNGEAVWFTPINPNSHLTGAFLARLAGHRLDYWTYPRPGRQPLNPGVAGERQSDPDNVWFSYSVWGPSSRVFRLNRPSNTFFEYEPQFAAPRKIVLDANRNAWISDWTGKVSMIKAEADCGTIKLRPGSIEVKSKRMRVKSQERRAKPKGHSVAPTQTSVSPAKDNCYRNYPLPYPLASNGIGITDPGTGPEIYFSEGSGRTIGKLIP